MTDFSAQLDAAYKKKVEGLLQAVVVKTALDVDRDLVLETPVGNPALWKSPAPAGYVGGHARANWLASLNNPRTSEAAGTDRQAGDSVQSITSQFNVKDTIYISNNVPYIQRLNDGWSTQAPIGFIDAIISRHKARASRAAKGLVK